MYVIYYLLINKNYSKRILNKFKDIFCFIERIRLGLEGSGIIKKILGTDFHFGTETDLINCFNVRSNFRKPHMAVVLVCIIAEIFGRYSLIRNLSALFFLF